MDSPLLMGEAPSTLAELVTPLSETEFLALLRSRELAYRPGSNAQHFAPQLGWAGLRRMIGAGNYSNRKDTIRVTKASAVVPAEKWMTDGKADPGKLEAFLAKGFSIVVTRIESYVPALAAICDEIKSRTREGSFVGAIVTSGAGAGAFRTHYDPEDLIILQVEGTKRWQVFGPVVSNPLNGMPKQELKDPEPILDEVLAPGDLLFVPGGYWHRCESGLSTSVHLGIFLLPPTCWHVVNEMVRPLIADETFRKPLTRLDDEASLQTVEAELKRRLVQEIEDLNLERFVAGWHKIAY